MTETDLALQRRVKELEFLVGVLLGRSGLDADGVVRAFEVAKIEVAKHDEAMLDLVSQRLLETPEGREQSRRNAADFAKRVEAAWREACLDEGRILPKPDKL